MVEPEQVQKAMGQKHRELVHRGPRMLFRLSCGRVERNHDIAEHMRMKPFEERILAFVHRKREHIGGLVFVPIVAVEHVDGWIITEHQGEFSVFEAHRAKHAARARFDLGFFDPWTHPTFDSNHDWHAPTLAHTPSFREHIAQDENLSYAAPMFEKVLIANRGEVAARVARTCRRIGADTVAVHVEGDESTVHVQACDESMCVGSSTQAAYTDIEALVNAAKESGCVALHPGYGLFDDNPFLARACERASITFIGPSPEELVLFRDRVAMRGAAIDAGLRVLPGSERPIHEIAQLREDADLVGFPFVLKPAFGVGEPEDSVLIESPVELEALLSRIEWDEVHYVERHVDRSRHVEVQLVGDGAGGVVVLGDREVSVRKDQRRVLSESPSPAIDALRWGDAVRSAIWAAAIDLTLSLQFRGVGSAHFLLDARGSFYFLGFHPALQIEHAVHELCANVDFVETQVRLAHGEPMPPAISQAEPTGHAVQTRIEAALNPQDKKPFGGRADDVRWPPAPTGKVRIETGIQPGSRVNQDHDPLVATVTTYAPTRHEAVLMLDRIIAETRIAPLVTNLRLIRRALNHESFRASQYDEGFLDRVSASGPA